LLRNLGFTKPRFLHKVAGYNFRMTGYQAAMGLAQFEKIERIIEQKRALARRYRERLSSVRGLRLPVEMSWAKNVYWMYAVAVTPEFGVTRDELAAKLASAGIETRTFFCPMNQQPCLLEIPEFKPVPCPVADELWRTGLYLPSTYTLTDDELDQIRDAIVAARA
jgi:perosamine synthetase